MDQPLDSGDNLDSASLQDLKNSLTYWTDMRVQPHYPNLPEATRTNIDATVTALALEIDSRS